MEQKRHFFSGIAFRLLVFNIILVFLPAAFFFFLSTYEQQLLKYLENSLVQQGRIISAAVGGAGTLDSGLAKEVIGRLRMEQEARYRVLDTGAQVIVDSSGLGPAEPAAADDSARLTDKSAVRQAYDKVPSPDDPPAGRDRLSAEDSLLYRAATFPVRFFRTYLSPPQAPLESADFYVGKDRLDGREVIQALNGGYGAATRISSAGQISVTLYSALPVWNRDRSAVIGAVLVSQSTYRLLRDLYSVRLDIFRIFLGSVAAAVLLSIFLSLTISRPLRRLGNEALTIFDADKKFRGGFSYQSKKDEIGSLARALNGLSARLKGHIQDMESFAGDVSHELKNPMASIRSAAELSLDIPGEDERKRFLQMILSEAVRMEALLSRVREVSVLDGRLEHEEKKLVEVTGLSESVLESFRIREQGRDLTYNLNKPAYPVYINASPERIVQVLSNLLDNAAGFSPEKGFITLTVEKRGLFVFLIVADEGPGIPASMEEDVFRRFFSYRERQDNNETHHSGLGLSIVKAIVERYDGTIRITGNSPRGAVFTIRLPAA